MSVLSINEIVMKILFSILLLIFMHAYLHSVKESAHITEFHEVVVEYDDQGSDPVKKIVSIHHEPAGNEETDQLPVINNEIGEDKEMINYCLRNYFIIRAIKKNSKIISLLGCVYILSAMLSSFITFELNNNCS